MRLIALLVAGVISPFLPPLPYGAGHRGVDFSAAVGQVVVAPAPGRLSYVGTINHVDTITIDIGTIDIGTINTGVRKVTLQPVSSSLKVGAHVQRGDVIGRIQKTAYHCTSCLHVGVRVGSRYVNPLFLSRNQLLPIGRSSWVDDQ